MHGIKNIHVFIDNRVGGPHYFAKSMMKDQVSSKYLFAGDILEIDNSKSIFPLCLFKVKWRLVKLLQYTINMFILVYYFNYRCSRDVEIVIHSLKNYPAIFACFLSRTCHFVIINHEEIKLFDGLLLRLIIALTKTGYFRKLDICTVANSIINDGLRASVKLLRYEVAFEDKKLLNNAYKRVLGKKRNFVRILLIGNISPVKNQAQFLKLLCGLDRKFHISLYGARTGNYTYLNEFDKAVEKFQSKGNTFEFKGFNKKEVIWQKLSDFDLFCLPSLSEAAPLVIYEMRETGIPILYTNVGDCAELLDGYKFSVGIDANRMSSSVIDRALRKLI